MSKAFWILLRHELRNYLRGKPTMFWTFAFPIFLLAVMVLAFGRTGTLGTVGLELVDRDRSEASARYVDAMKDLFSRGDPVGARIMPSDGSRPLPKGTVRVIVPSGFERALVAGTPSTIEVRYDAGASVAVRTAAKVVDTFTTMFSVRMQKFPVAVSASLENVSQGPPPLRYVQYIVVGILVMALMSSGVVTTCIALASLREQNAFKAFSCLPMRKGDYLAAMLVTRALMMLAATFTLLVVAKYMVGLEIEILSLQTLNALIFIAAGSAMLLALGILLGARPRSVATATLVANIVYFPMFFLGDLTIPINDFPGAARRALSWLPVHDLAQSLRSVLFLGHSVAQEGTTLLLLLMWGVLFLVSARLLFRWNER